MFLRRVMKVPFATVGISERLTGMASRPVGTWHVPIHTSGNMTLTSWNQLLEATHWGLSIAMCTYHK